MRYAAIRSKQEYRNRLMMYLQHMGCQRILACHEMQAIINHAKLAAFQPDQPMSIRMGNAGRFQPESPFQHALVGLSNNRT